VQRGGAHGRDDAVGTAQVSSSDAAAAADARGEPLSRWTHVHARFGLPSWKAAAAPFAPVLLHYVTEKPWNYVTYWDDYAPWEAAARAVAAASPVAAAFLAQHSHLAHPGPRVHDRRLGAGGIP
jgi:hypothetical protein